jgi:hypothetical protein
MSNSDQPGVRLIITTADSATEIFVLDARFHLVNRGIGMLDDAFPPGLYMVRARSGPETREEVVLLPRDASEPVRTSFAPISFGTPAPLTNTGKTHEYHIELARDVSATVQISAGVGSWLFVCAREWSGQSVSPSDLPARSPIRGLSLRTLDGVTIADLEGAAVKRLDVPDPCAACTVQVNPGAYRLVLDAAPGLTVEQTVVASPGWQTQVFMLQHDYADSPEWRRADMVGASILMANGPGFEADSDEQRLAEMARLALRDGRRVLSNDLRSMLQGKFSDPMLGIFGAHLLLREQEIDESLFHIVVDNLRALLGDHPDVEALRLRLQDPTVPPFGVPPMLRRSWELILNATVMRPELVPPDSPLAGIAPRIWGEGPWLIWMERSDEDIASDVAQIAQSMSVQIGAQIAESASQSRSTDGMTSGAASSDVTGATRGDFSFGMESAVMEGADGPSVVYDEATVSRLVQSLGVPRSTIEKIIGQS